MRVPLVLAAALVPQIMNAQSKPIVIRADRVIDGGGVVVEGAKISKVNAKATDVATYDLKGMTLLPGLIDAHAHLTWYFNRKGRFHSRGDGDTPIESMLSAVGN